VRCRVPVLIVILILISFERSAFQTLNQEPLLATQPFVSRNSCLPKKSAKKSRPNIAFVLVRDNDRQSPSLHLSVFATREWSFETQFVQALDNLRRETAGNLGI